MVIYLVSGMDIQVTPSAHTYALKYNLVYFLCKVTGEEKAEVTWAFNGKLIKSPPPYAMKWSEGGMLMIRPLFVGRSDGFYECIAKDSKGTTMRKGFQLTVKEGR